MELFENSIKEPDSSLAEASTNTLCDCAYSLAQASPSNVPGDLSNERDSLVSGETIDETQLENISEWGGGSLVPNRLNPSSDSNLFPETKAPLGTEFEDTSSDKTNHLARSIEQPIITRADIERYLKRTDYTGFGANLDILNNSRQSGTQKPELISDYFDALDGRRYKLPNDVLDNKPVYDFSKLRIPEQHSNSLPVDRYLPGKTDGSFAHLEFQTDIETLEEQIAGIGRFNFETRRGKKIQLEVLRDCGPGDYGLCIKIEQ